MQVGTSRLYSARRCAGRVATSVLVRVPKHYMVDAAGPAFNGSDPPFVACLFVRGDGSGLRSSLKEISHELA